MNKKDFTIVVRENLKKVPLDTRKSWTSLDLNSWWHQTKNGDPYLVCRCSGDLWQSVHGICIDMIGKDAIM